MDISNLFCAITLLFFLELETKKGSIAQRVQLDRWAAAGLELTAIGKCAQIFNP